ncbi:MAG: GNAT family N-acetyltransferase [Chitinophagaceae bacterium]|nr:GNAT family N-acetyltransferase [Chitinophagaceae bacterium]
MLTLESERLAIRNFDDTDLEAFYAYRKDPEVAMYQGFEPFTKSEAKIFIESQKHKVFGASTGWHQFAVIKKENNLLIGDCAIKLNDFENNEAEIGCTISPLYQAKGYGKETLLTILEFLFEKFKMRRIVETTDVENIASIRLLESTGFRKEAHFKENIWFNNKWGSEYQFAMLNHEWINKINN